MKFGQLVLRIIIKIVATRCQIVRLKCTKFDFGWGSAPDPACGAYSAPQTLDLRGLLLRGGRGEERKGERERKEWVRKRKVKGGESVPLALILQFDHGYVGYTTQEYISNPIRTSFSSSWVAPIRWMMRATDNR